LYLRGLGHLLLTTIPAAQDLFASLSPSDNMFEVFQLNGFQRNR